MAEVWVVKFTPANCSHPYKIPRTTFFGYVYGWGCPTCGYESRNMTYTCQDCGTSGTVDDEEGKRMLETGDLVKVVTAQPGWSSIVVHGICTECRRKAAKTWRRKGKRDADAEHRQLMYLLAQTRSAHPDWSLKKCVREAVEYVNRPDAEIDSAFRAYLMDRENP